MSIHIKNVSKAFGSFHALKNIDLEIEGGDLVALLGPSGSGKTTLLRIIAGLENSDNGVVLFNGQDNSIKKVEDRNVGFVFQHYALFKHMTVYENIAFGLKVKPKKERKSKEEIDKKVRELLALVKMEGMANRYPNQLSGGQKQRIALARALAVEPKVLLLDEPFGALDAKVRKELRRWLRKLHDEYQITSIFVTHDQEEALDVADKIVVLNKGEIEQIGTPEEVYNEPKNSFVYNFLGNVNLFNGRHLVKGDEITSEFKEVNSKKEIFYARPHDIDVYVEEAEGTIKSKVDFIRAVGAVVNIELTTVENKEIIEVELNKDIYSKLSIKEGQVVYVKPREVKVFVEDYVI